jgi:Fe(3+) dicitrate transport protein
MHSGSRCRPLQRPQVLAVTLISLFAAPAMAQTAAQAADQGKLEVAQALPPITVIGSKDDAAALVGSGQYVDREDITRQGYDDIHRLLREIPGVYVREEDGYGLFPNISLRGVDPGRSAKLTLMEDGILTAPAPYTDPAAYYSPTAGRMHGIEVLKGSSQVRYGPHSTGGVINYLSTPVPESREGYVRSVFGSDNEFRNQVWVGETVESAGSGRFGYLVEIYQRSTDGFKELDQPQTRVGPGAGDTGFSNVEPMIKLSWEPATALRQRFELKYGYTERDADETYLGLTTADFDANPYRRYAGSRFDNIATEHKRSYLRHSIAFSEATQLTTTAYYNEFHRNWFKIFGVNDGSANVSLGAALADPARAQALAVLRGEAAGTLRYRNNNREYSLRGVETQVAHAFATGSIEHRLHGGLRLHEDDIFRFQNDETFTQDDSGAITGHMINAPGSQENREAKTRALSAWLEDEIRIGRLTLRPGVRIEDLDWDVANFNNGSSADGGDSFYTAGIGVNWEQRPGFNWFGGLYQGISPPDPGSGTAAEPAKEERSLSLEAGLRYSNGAGLSTEAVLFATRFDNLIVTGNLGASGTGDGGAVGEVDVYGLEYALRFDPLARRDGTLQLPMFLAVTYTSAEIANDSTGSGSGGGNVESIFSGGRKGAELPYIPEWQATAGIGLRAGIWALDLQAQYVDAVWATALNSREEVILAAADTLAPDARGGRIDSIFLVDLTASAQVHPRVKLFANVFNLLDNEYIVSRLPEGPRPGAPLTALVGLEARLF